MATFVVNGRTVTAERNQKLLRFLRDELRLTSVKDASHQCKGRVQRGRLRHLHRPGGRQGHQGLRHDHRQAGGEDRPHGGGPQRV